MTLSLCHRKRIRKTETGKGISSSFFRRGPTWVCLLVLLLAAPGVDAQEPEGFRGWKWGEPVRNIPGLILVTHQNGVAVYQREGENLRLGEGKVRKIEYYFYRDRFMGVYMPLDGITNFKAIKKYFFQTYGPAKQQNFYLSRFRWLSQTVLITVSYEARSNSGAVLFCYLPLWNEQARAQDPAKTK